MKYTLRILKVCSIVLLCAGCELEQSPADCQRDRDFAGIIINLYSQGSFDTRSMIPDEEKIHDLNMFIFNSDSTIEESFFVNNLKESRAATLETRWLNGTECIIYACANFGFKMNGISTISQLSEYRYHLAYADEYSRGIPMSGKSMKTLVNGQTQHIDVPLIRLVSKISLDIDRSNLDPGVKFTIHSVQIGGSPKSVSIFSPSKAENTSDVFSFGFMLSDGQADMLNIDKAQGISREANLYMLENMQGELLPNATNEKDKILDISDDLSTLCSYVEIKAEYMSDTYQTLPKDYLIYRFYLGDSPSNFDIERNCQYKITVKPDGRGLSEDSWRIDKSGLIRYGSASLTINPGNYIKANVGDDVHIRADVNPEDARVEFGAEELEYDKSRGIYDYTIDNDKKGVVLHLKKRGSGLLYVEAGYPTSDSAIIAIEVI